MTIAVKADDLQRFVYWRGEKSTNQALRIAIDTKGMCFDYFTMLSTIRPLSSWARSWAWHNYDDVHWLRQQTKSARFYQLRDGVPTAQHYRLSLGQLWMLWNTREQVDWKALVGVADIMGLIRSLETKEVVGIT